MPSQQHIRFQRPELPSLDRVQTYFAASQETRWFSNGGPCSELLSQRVRARLGVAHVHPVANCTLALELLLRAVVEWSAEGRRYVVMPSYTFAATACAVVSAGLQPLFVDAEIEGWHADADAVAGALDAYAGQVAAILTCSTFGTPPPADQLLAWRAAADLHGVPLLVDAAAGLGAWAAGAGADSTTEHRVADAVAYSMHATKPFAVGEGGLIATGSDALAGLVRRLGNFGFDEHRRVAVSGTNAKLDELACAMALCALDDIDKVVARRRTTAARLWGPLEDLGLVRQGGSERATWQAVYLQAETAGQRDAVLSAAHAGGVEVRSYFSDPLHSERPFAAGVMHGGLPVTARLASGALALPMANDLTDDEVERIVAVVTRGLQEERRVRASRASR